MNCVICDILYSVKTVSSNNIIRLPLFQQLKNGCGQCGLPGSCGGLHR
jgi:hypothetical protein